MSSTQPGSKLRRILVSGEKSSSVFAVSFAGIKPERSPSTFSYPKAWSAFWCCQDLQWWIICDLSGQSISVIHSGCSNPRVSPCSSHSFSSTSRTRISERGVLQKTGERPANMRKGTTERKDINPPPVHNRVMLSTAPIILLVFPWHISN